MDLNILILRGQSDVTNNTFINVNDDNVNRWFEWYGLWKNWIRKQVNQILISMDQTEYGNVKKVFTMCNKVCKFTGMCECTCSCESCRGEVNE